jgi:cell division control protein 11
MFTAQKMIRRKKNVKKGIQFCLMVCGASGTGESPFQQPKANIQSL